MRPSIAVVVVCREEVDQTLRCLESVKDFAKTWRALDLSHKDSELQFKQKLENFDGEYVRGTWCGSYSEHYNSLISLTPSEYDYVLVLRASEVITESKDAFEQNLGESVYNLRVEQNGVSWCEARLFKTKTHPNLVGDWRIYYPDSNVYDNTTLDTKLLDCHDGYLSKIDDLNAKESNFLERQIDYDPGNVYWKIQELRDLSSQTSDDALQLIERLKSAKPPEPVSWLTLFFEFKIRISIYKSEDSDSAKKAKHRIQTLMWALAYQGKDHIACQYYIVKWLYRCKRFESAYLYGELVLDDEPEFYKTPYCEENIHRYQFNLLMGQLAEILNKTESSLAYNQRVLESMNAPSAVEIDVESKIKNIQERQSRQPAKQAQKRMVGCEDPKSKTKAINPINIDAIYVINLDEDKRRWDKVTSRLSAYPSLLAKTKRFSAVKAPGQIGCVLSHRTIVSNAKKAGLDTVLVFEDDVLLDSDFDAKLEASLDMLKGQQWDMLYLGGYKTFFYGQDTSDNEVNIRPLRHCYGTQAVLYNQTSYDQVLDMPSEPGKEMDRWIERHIAIDQFYNHIQLKRFMSSPQIARQSFSYLEE